jgi:uncharacterized membrane protein required for colicin V production
MIAGLTYLDIGLIVVPILFVLLGLWIGATRLVLSGMVRFFVGLFAGLLAAGVVGLNYFMPIAQLAVQYNIPPIVAQGAVIGLLMLVVLILVYSFLGWIKRALLGVIAENKPVYVVDRILGVPFGAALSVVLIALFVVAPYAQFRTMTRDPKMRPVWITQSQAAPYLDASADVVAKEVARVAPAVLRLLPN